MTSWHSHTEYEYVEKQVTALGEEAWRERRGIQLPTCIIDESYVFSCLRELCEQQGQQSEKKKRKEFQKFSF